MRIHISLTDEAEKLMEEKFGQNKKGISQYISELIVKDSIQEKPVLDAELLERISTKVHYSDRNMSILLDAFNNFLLNFTTPGTEYRSMSEQTHDWIKRAKENEVKKMNKNKANAKWKVR